MSNRTLTDAVSSKPILGKGLVKWERFAMLYARFALGTAFLSAVAGRFGIWGENTGPDSFKHFIEYTAEVNSFMPAFTIPFLAWTATIAENLPWHCANSRNLASFRGAGCGGAAGSVWQCYGDLVGHQKSARLFSVFCVRRSVAVS